MLLGNSHHKPLIETMASHGLHNAYTIPEHEARALLQHISGSVLGSLAPERKETSALATLLGAQDLTLNRFRSGL